VFCTNIFHDLRDFWFRQRNVHDQTLAVLKNVFFTTVRRDRRGNEQEKERICAADRG